MKLLIIIFFTLGSVLGADIIVIANKNVPSMDTKTIAKVFTGKMIVIDSINVIPIHLGRQEVKNRFLQKFLGMNDEQYIAYWTVRQYIGKGTPPKEFATASAVIAYVKQTSGAMGYINETDLIEDMNIISKRQ